jgi:hypothetical protein
MMGVECVKNVPEFEEEGDRTLIAVGYVIFLLMGVRNKRKF